MTVLPTVAEAADAVLVNETSAGLADTVVLAEALLFPGVGSDVALLTLAVSVRIVPLAWRCRRRPPE